MGERLMCTKRMIMFKLLEDYHGSITRIQISDQKKTAKRFLKKALRSFLLSPVTKLKIPFE
ncbi:hypothetical protein GT94_00150 [Geobacillus stearothermophilus]|nr:hypothetical protein ET31_12575 [Geobacillus stearothermophilus]KFX37009.1 hypothetical protein GT94_00150 [Geobacillus stearothermophilus]